ncbi:MAG: hypothetical protein RLZZ126_226 [Pseudomonadota bacterium]|jgi:hypothetical protein
MAESRLQTGSFDTPTASARLDFRITVPASLSLHLPSQGEAVQVLALARSSTNLHQRVDRSQTLYESDTPAGRVTTQRVTVALP